MLSIYVLVEALLFILPAYLANIAPVFFHKIFSGYNFPIDFGRNFFDGKRIFGDGKTWNGLILGTMIGGLVGYLEGNVNIGLVLGFGALFGDLVKSFFKRRIGKVRGASWFPFDQIDFILGAFLFYYLFFRQFVLTHFFILLILTPILHLATNWLGFKLKLKKEPW
ncbi:MAG: CDP-2,3-bis-(O-geranylgeranyl)-sn-glycerol synthase [DPANN group archaeon]|nr:CDP-2,3-bis-(O-geranylgeranyl)-sn-glycerol synthase [DPANN group archaeon]